MLVCNVCISPTKEEITNVNAITTSDSVRVIKVFKLKFLNVILKSLLLIQLVGKNHIGMNSIVPI